VRDNLINLEKQLAEMKSSNQNMLLKHKELQTSMGEQSNTIASLKSQIGELSNSLRNRDAALSKESALRREAGVEAERLKVRAEEAEHALETNKPKESENSQLEALRVCSYLYIPSRPRNS
jgi:E3 ubiquitin-protein ligase BRE1